MFVAAPVSSTNTSRCGFSRACPARVVGTLPGKLGPLLLLRPQRLFFGVWPSRTSPVPQPKARGHTVTRPKPGAQLVQSRIRALRYLGPDRIVMSHKLELLVVAPRPRLGLAGRSAPAEHLVALGDADPGTLGHRPRRSPDHRQPSAAPIRRVALPRFPRHHPTSVHAHKEKRASRPAIPVNRAHPRSDGKCS